jgi:hypothetical protein
MTCGGSHLGFPIGIKNREPSNDHSWAVWFQLSKWFQRLCHMYWITLVAISVLLFKF